MTTSHCSNCGHLIQVGAKKYCSNCGQSTETHRLSFKHFLHEMFHAFTHTDKGIFFLLKGLALRPGIVAKEYIDGKRKKYFNPFTFLLIVMAFFVLSEQFFSNKKIENNIPTSIQKIPDAAAREKAMAMYKRGMQVRDFTSKKASLVSLIAIPFLSLVFWVAYRKGRFNYAEHLTTVLMFTAFSNLFFGLLIFPMQKLLTERVGIIIGLALQSIYFSWGYIQLMGAGTLHKKSKAILVAALGIILWFLLSITLMAIYIYRSSSFYQFFARMIG